MDSYNLQSAGSSDGCLGERHQFRPYIGDPVPMSYWNGQLCACGGAVLVLCKCECGHEHLTQVSAKPEPMFGTHIRELYKAIRG